MLPSTVGSRTEARDKTRGRPCPAYAAQEVVVFAAVGCWLLPELAQMTRAGAEKDKKKKNKKNSRRRAAPSMSI